MTSGLSNIYQLPVIQLLAKASLVPVTKGSLWEGESFIPRSNLEPACCPNCGSEVKISQTTGLLGIRKTSTFMGDRHIPTDLRFYEKFVDRATKNDHLRIMLNTL